MLHARAAVLDHPRDRRQRLRIEAPLPDDMRALLEVPGR
jgi:hypothetical protein